MSVTNTTVIICARNAERTISRAIDSALAQGSPPILLVDDYSEDATARIALEVGGKAISVVRPSEKLGLGNARNVGIHNVKTKYAVWLDADDMLLPGRLDSLEASLASGADVVFDAAELVDGSTQESIRQLPMPEFMLEPGGIVRLFERNYLPGPAWPGVRVAFARDLGYDTELPTGEDIDFNLRAIAAGGRFRLLAQTGYRQFHYPDSLSRDLELQRSAVRTVLEKHSYEQVRRLFANAGHKPRIADWALCSMALFRSDFGSAVTFAREAYPPESVEEAIIDPNGPLPMTEGWRQAFFMGTLDLLLGGSDSERWLDRAESLRQTPEGANNLGVAFGRRGDAFEANVHFERALARFPGYRDALLNSRSAVGSFHVTTHPLRWFASRSEYSAD